MIRERLAAWLFDPLPDARVAVLRLVVYAFLVVDVLWWHTSGEYHGYVDSDLYRPLLIGRLLPLPEPTYLVVQICKWGTVVAAVAAISGRAPRVLGWTAAALWLEYQVIAFSYGKVDHDRFGLVVALVVLPTVGRVGLRSTTSSEAAGWALRTVQMAAVATYFYAALAKLRFGGPEWVNSATIARAVIRRGTELAQPLLEVPWTLQATQWGIMAMELSAPLVFLLTVRWQYRVVAFWLSFHVVTYAMIKIIFLPHLVCLLAFLPLERLVPGVSSAARRRPAGRGSPTAAAG